MALKRPVFKPYMQQQILALPPTLEELIPAAHPVRVVNDVINKLNIEPLLEAYNIRGSSSYHPQMLLKVVVYGYVTNTYSSRKLAAACKESVYLMWLSSMSYPDHNTINRFRGVRLKNALRSVFEDVLNYWQRKGCSASRKSIPMVPRSKLMPTNTPLSGKKLSEQTKRR